MSPDQFYQSLDEIGKGDNAPPVDIWNPALSGDMDLVIKSNGEWVHDGSAIKRAALVRIFSKIIKRENDEYYLVTPQEKWRIHVEDAPFLVNRIRISGNGGEQVIQLLTTTDNSVTADSTHPLWIEYDEHKNPKPYVIIRNNLHALINRSSYQDLVEIAEMTETDEKTVWKVRSAGNHFLLGEECH